MLKIKYCLLFFAILSSLSVFSQRNTYSPYSRYGIGDFYNAGSGFSKSMGATGIALRRNNEVNIINPASSSARDTLSFIIDAAINIVDKHYSTVSQKAQYQNANIDYLSIGFPINRWCFINSGLMPYSSMGYSIVSNRTVNNMDVEELYSGTGSINRFVSGASAKIGNHLSLGLNLSYLFGMLEYKTLLATRSENVLKSNTEFSNTIDVHDVMFTFGLQAYTSFASKHFITFGAIYEAPSNLNAIKTRYIKNYIPEIDNEIVILDSVIKGNEIKLPERIGLGMSYVFDNKICFASEYLLGKFSEPVSSDMSYQSGNTNTIRAGVEYADRSGNAKKGYLKKINYRIGVQYNEMPVVVMSERITDKSVSFGIGLPYKNTQSVFNIAFEIGRRGATTNGLVLESYKMITIGFSAFDRWFMKSKFD